MSSIEFTWYEEACELSNENIKEILKMNKTKHFIIRNMQTGKSEMGNGALEDIERLAELYAQQNPNSEVWVYEKIFSVKAQVPVVITRCEPDEPDVQSRTTESDLKKLIKPTAPPNRMYNEHGVFLGYQDEEGKET